MKIIYASDSLKHFRELILLFQRANLIHLFKNLIIYRIKYYSFYLYVVYHIHIFYTIIFFTNNAPTQYGLTQGYARGKIRESFGFRFVLGFLIFPMFLKHFGTVPFAPIISGKIIFIFQKFCSFMAEFRYLYSILSISLLERRLSLLDIFFFLFIYNHYFYSLAWLERFV